MISQPFLIPAVLILLFSIPLVIGIVPRNRFYGIRTRKTLFDDAIWYRTNRFGGWALIIASILYLGLAWIMPYDRKLIDNFPVWTVHFCGFIIPLTVGVILTLWYCRRL
jgi:uncharacterized membrane protein